MIEEFGLGKQKVYDRAGVQMAVRDDRLDSDTVHANWHNLIRYAPKPKEACLWNRAPQL